jgi:heme a synthase
MSEPRPSASPRPIENLRPNRYRPGLHRFAVGLACAVVALVAAGAFVKSKEAGLSVPDWPLSYGGLNPPRWWQIDTVRAEHGHRLFAGTIALATVALAVWTQRAERRPWVRRLAWGAVGAVLAQALLGGITVLLFLPPAVSIAHAGLAQLFLCLIVSLAVATGPGFQDTALAAATSLDDLRRLRTLAVATTAAVYCQILLGALVRHNGAGLAIPDFPLVFGGLVPPRFTFPVAIHYAHRVGALVVATLVFATAARVLTRLRAELWLRRPALLTCLLVLVQIALGGTVVLTGRAVLPNTAHVAMGAALLAWTLVLAWRAARLAHVARLHAAGEALLAGESAAPARPAGSTRPAVPGPLGSAADAAHLEALRDRRKAQHRFRPAMADLPEPTPEREAVS